MVPTLSMQGIDSSAFLVESTYASSGQKVDVKWTKGRWILTRGSSDKAGMFSSLRKELIPKSLTGKKPQSIRLRYRIKDKSDSVETKFKLGFTFVISLKIQLDKVEHASAEGIIDIHNYWFGNIDAGLDPLVTHEKAVPASILMCQ